MADLTRTWLILIALIVATIILAGHGGLIVSGLLLVLALAKARMIFSGFLGLSWASGWLAAFIVPLAIWMVAIWGLYAI